MHDNKADGCELPEELRQYYLDVMGIQVWQDLDAPSVTDAAIPVSEKSEQISQQQSTKAKAVDVAQCDWSELEALIAQCQCCELSATRTQTVFGAGNQNADLLVVGEAPGQEEDAQGEPFVGEAGKLLTSMLKAIDLSREDVYITNILKCHPPENRDPRPEEIKHCHDYLRRQIALLKPRAIYAVGRVAAQALLNSKESISHLREHQHTFENIPLVASFHPAYLLRKPSEKRKAWHDLQQLKSLLVK